MDALLGRANAHIAKGLPFCLYRKPSHFKVLGVFQRLENLYTTTDFSEKGFVFAPFDLSHDTVLISPDEMYSTPYQKEDGEKRSNAALSSKGKDFYLGLVNKGLAQIKHGTLEKVVLSRKITMQTLKDPVAIFVNLLDTYQNAFCYLFFHPRVGTWCGATPETLLNLKGDELKTMSLAGTLPQKDLSLPKWGKKEVEEQAMVTSYIKQRLGPKMEHLTVGGPKTVKAGDLWHLRSMITGKPLKKTSIGEMIAAIHPTPAVCGIPREKAQTFILENEGYRRTYYSGFLGTLSLGDPQETALYVNLRCMELQRGTAYVFVGGGITSGSNPSREWEETQNKSRTMLDIL